LGSCFRPETADSGGIFRAIEKQRLKDNLRFILLIGDQIYADAYQYNGLGKIACTLDEYRKVYEYTWSRPPFRELLYNLPAFMTLDDHEVDDDWTWTDSSRTRAQIPIWDRVERYLKGLPREERQLSTERVRAALQAYWEHQGMHSPHFIQPLRLNAIGQYGLTPNDAGSLAYSFTFGSAAFFVLDTRTMRVKGRRGKTMLGEGQWLALESWLLAVKDRFPVKFLVSSCALIFQLWLDIARDRWTGFPEERSRLLNFIASHGIEGTYVLTGDLHCAHAISADLEGPQGLAVPLWEFCATPFEQVPQVLSHRTYYPLRGSPVLSEKLHFIVAQYNYGVVRVSFDANGKPAVHYEVYGENGDLLAEVG
jgi:alkaline phosphatase D